MAFDLSELEIDPSEKGSPVKLLHPVTLEETGITMFVLRRQSRAGKRKVMETYRANPKEKIADGDSEREETDAEHLERLNDMIVCAMITGWETDEEDNCIPVDGERFEYSPENAAKIVFNPKLYWVYDQVNSAMNSFDAVFTKATKG